MPTRRHDTQWTDTYRDDYLWRLDRLSLGPRLRGDVLREQLAAGGAEVGVLGLDVAEEVMPPPEALRAAVFGTDVGADAAVHRVDVHLEVVAARKHCEGQDEHEHDCKEKQERHSRWPQCTHGRRGVVSWRRLRLIFGFSPSTTRLAVDERVFLRAASCACAGGEDAGVCAMGGNANTGVFAMLPTSCVSSGASGDTAPTACCIGDSP